MSTSTSAEASWPDIWNKEAESLKDTVLVNEMDNERGLVHLGMTKDELISVLDSIGIIFDVMESDTGDRCYLASFYLFEDYISICINHDVVDGIEIDGSIPLEAVSTQSGLNLGDSFNTMIQLYGEDYTIYETEDSGKIYEYIVGDHTFYVEFSDRQVSQWGISKNSETTQETEKDYSSLGAQLVEDIIIDLVGGDTPEDIRKTLGEPDEMANINGVARWYYEQGIELDIVDQNDQPYLFNYIYLDSTSSIKINEDIGIGSTRDEILEKYTNEINPDNIKNSIIVAGTRGMGIIFIMDNDMVSSIYIATGAYTNPDARDIPE